jgi:hypothetical protein
VEEIGGEYRRCLGVQERPPRRASAPVNGSTETRPGRPDQRILEVCLTLRRLAGHGAGSYFRAGQDALAKAELAAQIYTEHGFTDGQRGALYQMAIVQQETARQSR